RTQERQVAAAQPRRRPRALVRRARGKRRERLMSWDVKRPSARALLAEAAADGADLETVARGVLARLAELTGLSSTYRAGARMRAADRPARQTRRRGAVRICVR